VTDKQPLPTFEARRDGWRRFETAVDAALKSGPKHRPAPKKRKPKAKKKTG
jgi:hypothetical protein